MSASGQRCRRLDPRHHRSYIDNSNVNSAANQGKSVIVKATRNNILNAGGSLGVGDVGVGADVHTIHHQHHAAYITDTILAQRATRTAVYGATGVEVQR